MVNSFQTQTRYCSAVLWKTTIKTFNQSNTNSCFARSNLLCRRFLGSNSWSYPILASTAFGAAFFGAAFFGAAFFGAAFFGAAFFGAAFFGAAFFGAAFFGALFFLSYLQPSDLSINLFNSFTALCSNYLWR